MRKIIFLFFVFFSFLESNSQAITVNTSTYTVPQLVQNILFGTNGVPTLCAGTITNITSRTGSNFGSSNGIGYFQNTNPAFPLSSGVILSTGSALSAVGPNSSTQSNGSNLWPGDTQLFNYIDNFTIAGLPLDPDLLSYNNATILEFDFVPISTGFSFDFLFASEEYGIFQCNYSDAFAFFLSNTTAGTPPVNLALVPGTATPISVITIRDEIFGPGVCINPPSSVNPGYFGGFYGGINAGISPTNFVGQTVKLTAAASLIPSNTYHIKLVIADRNDRLYDSAVFLGAGSFNIGQNSLISGTAGLDSFADFTISNGGALCSGDSKVIQAGAFVPSSTYVWKKDGNLIVGATNNIITVSDAGTYSISITSIGGCLQEDSFIVEIRLPLPTLAPIDLSSNGAFDLTQNTQIILNGLNPSDYIITYHSSLLNAQNGIQILDPANYLGANGDVIYVVIEDFFSGFDCKKIESFSIISQFPPPIFVVNNPSVCGVLNATVIATPNISGTYNYIWTVPLGATNPGNVASFTTNIAGTYSVIGTDTVSGLSSTSSSGVVTVNTIPVVTVNSPSVCAGTTATITATPITIGTYNYSWTVPVGASAPGNVASFNTSVAGIYEVVITDTATNCFSVNSSGTVTVNSKPTVTVASPIVCAGINATVTATPTTAGTYNFAWTVPVGASAPGNVASFTTTTPGIYSVIITDLLTTCFSNPLSITVIFNPTPIATILGSTPTVCLNFVTPSPSITFTGLGGTAPYTFSYTFNGAPFTATTLTGNSVSVVVPTNAVGPQTYVLTNVQDANCTNPQTGTAVINVLDAPIINTPLPYVVCDDDAVYNGIAIFNLHTKDLEVSSNPTLQISYYPTLPDATVGGILNQISPLPSDTYQNITSPFNQTVYIRVFDPAAPTCYSITQLQLLVNPRPLKNLLLTPLAICDVTAPLILEPFDLHTKDADIINGQTGVVVNYYTSEPLAILNNPINAIPNQNAYIIPTFPISATQTIWYNSSFTSNGCGTVGSLDLIVNPLPLATTPAYAPYNLCESTLVIDGIETFDLESKKQAILLGQLGVTVTFYPSPNDALNNTSPILTPTYTNVTTPFAQTLGIRLTNNLTKCYILSSIDLIVNPKPTPQVPPASLLSICSTDPNGIGAFDLQSFTSAILQGAINTTVTYHLTNTDAQNNTNILPSTPFINIVPFNQILYVRATNTLTGCFTVIMITITASPSPTVPTLSPNLIKDLVFCDEDTNNQDGITNVNLSTQTALLLGVQPGLASNFTVTYYTTLADATNSPAGLNPIITPATYLGTNNQDIWVRIENNTTKCFKVERFKIIINIPLALPAPTILSLCDDQPPAVVTTPETTVFNLVSLSNPKILVNTSTPADFSVAYYLTQAAADAGIGAINSNAFLNTVNPQTIFVVVTSKDGCKSKSTLTLSVLKVPVPKLDPAELLSKCDDNVVGTPNPVGFEYFDLTTNIAYIAGNLTDVTISYYQTLADATANPPVNAIANPANALVSGDVFIRVQSNINIDTQLVPCYVIVTQKLKVNPLPIVALLDVATHPNNTYQECQNPSTLPQIKFNLDSLKTELLVNNPTVTPPTTPPTYTNTYTTTFYTTAAGALAGTGAISNSNAYESTTAVSVAQTIYVRVVNNQTGCVNATGSFKIVVNPKPTITIPSGVLALNTCDIDGVNDGLYSYPLDNPALISGILGSQSATAFTLTFHETQAEATSGAGAITNLAGYMGYTHSLWIRVQNNTTKCFELAESKQVVEKIPEPIIETVDNINTICIDYITKYPIRPLTMTAKNITNPTATVAEQSYQWFIKNATGTYEDILFEGTNSSYTVDKSEPNGATRFYKVEIKNATALGCSVTSAEFEVIQSGTAVFQIGTNGYFVTNAFEQNQIITVTVVGYGTYQYSLDQGPRQDSPVFENVTLGDHEIEVFDNKTGLNSCESLKFDGVKTIDYPYYFTPNADGINDTWNINGLSKQFDAKIYIFDREGKLIKQIAPNGDGWDGNYNNSLMPSTDYWFTVDFTEQTIQKQFKSHFSLKR